MTPEFDLAALLRDVHPPPEPAWWPPAPGWWIAALLTVVLAAIAIRRAIPWWRRLRVRWRLLAALDAIAHRHRAGLPAVSTAGEISRLLRVAALTRFPHRGVAGLHGDEWIAFLDSRDRVPGRFAGLRTSLTTTPYAPPGTSADAAPLLHAARGWLRAVL